MNQKWKMQAISDHLLESKRKVPFFALTETHLKSYHYDAEAHVEGYNVFRADRTKRKQGGAALYVLKDISVTKSFSHSNSYCETVGIYIKSQNLAILASYRPPNAPPHLFDESLSEMEKFIAGFESPEVLILGDFNFPFVGWDPLIINPDKKSVTTSEQNCARSFLEFLDAHSLQQHVKESTRKDISILDLVLSNNHHAIHSIRVLKTEISDHDFVYCNVSYNLLGETVAPKPAPVLSPFDKYNYNKSNWDPIREELGHVNWVNAFKNLKPGDMQKDIEAKVLDACSRHTPLKGPRLDKPKISKERLLLTRTKKKISAKIESLKMKNGRQEVIDQLYKKMFEIELATRDQIRSESKTQEEEAIKKIKINPKFFHNYAKRFSKTSSSIGPLSDHEGTLRSEPKTMSEILAGTFSKFQSKPKQHYPDLENALAKSRLYLDHASSKPTPRPSLSDISFTTEDIIKAIDEVGRNSAVGPDKFPAAILKECKEQLATPLYIMWRLSLDSGEIPETFLRQSIVPIFKKGNKDDPANYRPVSLTSHLIKVFERVLRNGLVDFIESNNLLNANQHGFRKGRNCLSQLLHHYDDILHIRGESANADVVYLDFAKAFDKVDHVILLQKVKRLGITGKIYQWIKSFLSNRKQHVVVDGVISSSSEVVSGVPQGTVLGPLLFLIFIDDMSDVVLHSKVKLFADDSKLCKKVSSPRDQELLQEDLNAVLEWADYNNMELNEDKFQLIQHGSLAQFKCDELNNPYRTSTGASLLPSSSVVDLGITINQDLTWTTQVQEQVSKASQFTGWILRTFKSRSKELMLTLYNSLVRSRLEYCCPLWSPYLKQHITKIESVQRSYTAKIAGLKDLSYWDRLKSLRLYSLQRRRERYIIIQIWKIWKGLIPNDLELVFKDNARLGPQCVRPNITGTSSLDTLKFNAFSSRGPALFNIIPNDVKVNRKDTQSFKGALDRFLGKFPDTPPTPGYIASNGNSLLEWVNSKQELLDGGSASHM